MLKFFALIAFCLTVLGTQAKAAEPFICVTDPGNSQVGFNATTGEWQGLIQEAAIRCSTLDVVGSGLEVVSISLDAGVLYSACTGVGAPVAIYLGAGSIVSRVIKLSVGNLPCDKGSVAEDVKATVHETVCQELSKNGLTCND